jgi:transcriptional regulator with XRE-family HTH domain
MSEEISSTLRHLIQRRGLQQAELARRSGLSEATVSRVLSGEQSNPTAETLLALARGLGITVADLLSEPPSSGARSADSEDLLLNLYRILSQEDRAKIVEYAEAISLKRRRERRPAAHRATARAAGRPGLRRLERVAD